MFLSIKMQAGITIVVVGILLAVSLGILFLPGLVNFITSGFGDFFSNGMYYFEQLFGFKLGLIFSSFVILCLLVLLFRFFISWIGEDSGGSANN